MQKKGKKRTKAVAEEVWGQGGRSGSTNEVTRRWGPSSNEVIGGEGGTD